jgi:hypothetical protein
VTVQSCLPTGVVQRAWLACSNESFQTIQGPAGFEFYPVPDGENCGKQLRPTQHHFRSGGADTPRFFVRCQARRKIQVDDFAALLSFTGLSPEADDDASNV